jgi:hypothetical protein
MATATLAAYSLPAAVPPFGLFADHTYVLSSDGYEWGCWGRWQGGAVIVGASGQGDSTVANCLSQANSRAGIAYAITGVCHQTANRILYPAAVTVSNARGYWGASHPLYGVYGRIFPAWVQNTSMAEDWPPRKARCSNTGSASSVVTPVPTPPSPATSSGFLTRVHALYEKASLALLSVPFHFAAIAEIARELVREETELTIDYRLGSELDSSYRAEIVQAHLQLYEARIPLAIAAIAGEIDGARYADHVDELLGRMLRYLAAKIEGTAFDKLFGLKPGEAIRVVEPETAALYLAQMRYFRYFVKS